MSINLHLLLNLFFDVYFLLTCYKWTAKEIGSFEWYSYGDRPSLCASSIYRIGVLNCLATINHFVDIFNLMNMLKGELLPSPTIIPLLSNPLLSKNKIDTQTFIEIRSGLIYFILINIRFVRLIFRCFKCTYLFYCWWNKTRSISSISS
jgi:hypothetical protein